MHLGKSLLVFVLLTVFLSCGIECKKLYFDQLRKNLFFNDPKEPVENSAASTHWVLLVAGSNGWDNYRHQADVSHAYQVVRKHGIPEENIITMMYDDIADNRENPTKGKIINHPHGPDVYKGVVVDYKKHDVTPENFLAVLRGDEEKMKHIGSGKVIKSGPNDHIFVNFVDHGAPGLLAFPSSQLYAKDFIQTIKSMHSKNQYNEMVIYIEACESGSMFENLLPSNISVYATTAANAFESSYACYYDDERQTYLGDLYSVNWMEDSDSEYLNMETIHKQYLVVKKDTNTSHVQEFGEPKISRQSLDNFQGEPGYDVDPRPNMQAIKFDAVPSEDVPLAILYNRLDNTNNPSEQQILKDKVKALIKEKDEVEDLMKRIVRRVSMMSNRHFAGLMGASHPLTDHDCYRTAVDVYDQHCYDISQNGYARKSLRKLVNMCEENISPVVIVNAITKACKN
ncbi:hypothetical protein HELRODRAFT_185311 [Helobdella robusta]|uniref:Hemoglobinase n=1 Tax=Helobdella robusta TaxID=6412 RepID=T1FMN3_HELRO|nr:hypothetical protein HELRODRAFT_185311 [Helobdella robusta]ESO10018.1 hypothetical protein HELRODRAFT_185311 [Helobdella robusta]